MSDQELTIVAAEVLEGWNAYEKLVRQHTQGPQVDLVRVLATFDHLWRQIVLPN